MKGKNRIGKWVYYHNDGKTIMQEENYVNGKLSGKYFTYFKNKNQLLLPTTKTECYMANTSDILF